MSEVTITIGRTRERVLRAKHRANLGEKADTISLARLVNYAVLMEIAEYWDRERDKAFKELETYGEGE